MSAILTRPGASANGSRPTARTPASGPSGGSRSRARCRRCGPRRVRGQRDVLLGRAAPATPTRPPTATRRLGWLVDDLLAVLADIDRFEAAQRPAAFGRGGGRVVDRRGTPPSRQRGGLVRRPARRGGLRAAVDGADPRAEAAGAHAWAAERVVALAAPTTGRRSTDGHGETWTLAKVVRRLVYHAFEHLWDLERRLARADGTGERVGVRLDRRPDAPTMAALLRSVGWDGRAIDPALGRAIRARPSSPRRGTATGWSGRHARSRTARCTRTSRRSSSTRGTRASGWGSA